MKMQRGSPWREANGDDYSGHSLLRRGHGWIEEGGTRRRKEEGKNLAEAIGPGVFIVQAAEDALIDKVVA